MLRSGILVLLAFAVLAAPAGAQDAAVTVAGPTPTGATLLAADRGAELCLTLREPTLGSGDPDCDSVPASAHDVALASSANTDASRWYAVVTPDVAAVELRFAGGTTVSAPTSAGPAYRGRFAGAVRFALVEAPFGPDRQPFVARMLDAGGHVIAAIDMFEGRAPIVRAPVAFASGRVEGRRWRARAYVRRELRATPLEVERTERVACVGLDPLGRFGLRAETCADEGPLQAVVRPGFDSACRPAGGVVTGIVAPRVARVVAVLGDGSRRRVTIRAFPKGLGVDRRAFVLVLDRDTALRRVLAVDRTGRTLERLDFGLAPARIHCAGLNNVLVVTLTSFIGPRGSELTPPPGPPRLLLADDGVRLCFSIGRFAPDGADCELPPLALGDSRILSQTTAGQTLIAGVLPASVTAVRLHLDGAVQVVPTAPTTPEYAGRYSGTVRFFALRLPATRRILGIDVLGAGGRVLLSTPGRDALARRLRTKVVRVDGLRVAIGAAAPRIPCIAIATGPCTAAFGNGVRVTAPCVPRRIVFTSVLEPDATGLDVRLAGGRTIRAHVVRLPAIRGLRGRLAVAVVPARERPLAVVLRRRARSPERVALPLAPAAEQCGYSGDTGGGGF